MAITRFSIAKPDIVSFFDNLTQRVFRRTEIDAILAGERNFWRLANNTTVFEFIEFLAFNGKLKEVRFEFPTRNEIRYYWQTATDYEIIQSLRQKSYFTHFTALSLNALTTELPKTIYLNWEQPHKENSIEQRELAQERIDYAFRRTCRISKTVAELNDRRICLLNGKFTNQKGVHDIQEQDTTLRTTDIERTLIDSAVRPIYAGGVQTVLEAYRAAQDRVSINKLCATLQSLNYIYPYHQAIGFYLERAGNYSEKQIQLLARIEKKFDFYLDYKIKEKKYSTRWKLYFPKGM